MVTGKSTSPRLLNRTFFEHCCLNVIKPQPTIVFYVALNSQKKVYSHLCPMLAISAHQHIFLAPAIVHWLIKYLIVKLRVGNNFKHILRKFLQFSEPLGKGNCYNTNFNKMHEKLFLNFMSIYHFITEPFNIMGGQIILTIKVFLFAYCIDKFCAKCCHCNFTCHNNNCEIIN